MCSFSGEYVVIEAFLKTLLPLGWGFPYLLAYVPTFLLAKMLHKTGNRISLGWWLKIFSLFLEVLMHAKMSLETWHCPSASCYEGIFWYFLSSLPREPAMSADLLCWSHCNSKLNHLGMNAWRSFFWWEKSLTFYGFIEHALMIHYILTLLINFHHELFFVDTISRKGNNKHAPLK